MTPQVAHRPHLPMPRQPFSPALELPVTVRRDGETRQAWVYRCVRERIETGALQHGDRLPSTRALAERWGVSRGIVELAFEQLTLEGYVTSRVGSGTQVLADLAMQQRRDKARPTAAVTPAPLAETAASLTLKTGRAVDTALFPLAAWRRHINDVLRNVTPAELADTDPRGWLPLREQIARYLRVTRGIACDPQHIVVTTGIRHAIELVTDVLAHDTTTFYLEDPGYKNLSALLNVGRRKVVHVPVDDEGFDMRGVDGGGAGIACVTPAHQAPLGVTMSINRRMQLLAWARANDVWILEDDYDSEFSYGSAPLPALKAIDTHERVVHCSSFNKSLLPTLRIGYLVAPPSLLPRVAALRAASGRNSLIEQMTLARFIASGDFARHLRAARSVYLRRRNLLLETLRAHLRTPCRISGEHAGFHCVLWLPPAFAGSEAEVVAALREQDVHVEGLQEFAHRQRVAPGLVVGYAALDDARIVANAQAMARVIERHCR